MRSRPRRWCGAPFLGRDDGSERPSRPAVNDTPRPDSTDTRPSPTDSRAAHRGLTRGDPKNSAVAPTGATAARCRRHRADLEQRPDRSHQGPVGKFSNAGLSRGAGRTCVRSPFGSSTTSRKGGDAVNKQSSPVRRWLHARRPRPPPGTQPASLTCNTHRDPFPGKERN